MIDPAVLYKSVIEEKAKRKLASYAKLVTHGKWHEAKHLSLIADVLEKIEKKDLNRVIISLPPRHGKSMLVSEIFPAWYLGKHPDDFIIGTSYSDALARSFSEKARNYYKEWAPVLWGQSISRTSSSKSRWTINGYNGGYLAAGAGGPITGFGARIAIIDDPIKNWQEAQSVTIRETIWDWYRSTLRTRLTHDGAIIIISTRWHNDDLIGRIVKESKEHEDSEDWEIINLPAIAEDNDVLGRSEGEPLWPERFGENYLSKTRTAVGPTIWSALYQGRPHAKEGALFDISKVKVHKTDEDFPKDVQWARIWDYAHTAKQRASDDPDYTSGTLLAFKKEDSGGSATRWSLWIKDVFRCREAAPARDAGIKRIADIDGPYVRIGVEDSIDSRDGFEAMRVAIGGRYKLERIKLDGDKVVRATPLEPIFENGDVHILYGPWNTAWFDELSNFPYSVHDDQVDNLSAGYRMLCVGNQVQRVRLS